MKVLVYGAGVIGQIYGGRLARSGHQVSMLARGHTAELLAERGITLRRRDECWQVRPAVIGVGDITSNNRFDVVLVTVRLDQVDEVVPDVARAAATRVAFLLNRGTGQERSASRSVPTAPSSPSPGWAVADSRTARSVTKEKPGFWTRRRAFEQIRHGSNIQLLSFSLVSAGASAEDDGRTPQRTRTTGRRPAAVGGLPGRRERADDGLVEGPCRVLRRVGYRYRGLWWGQRGVGQRPGPGRRRCGGGGRGFPRAGPPGGGGHPDAAAADLHQDESIHLYWARLPDDQVDGRPTGEPIEPDRHYVNVRLTEMYLGRSRTLWRKFSPLLYAFTAYGGDEQPPTVAGPGQLQQLGEANLDRVIVLNLRLAGPIPYQGEELSIVAGLYSVPREDAAAALVTTLGALAEVAGPGAADALKLAQIVKSGVDSVLNLNTTRLRLGVLDTFGGANLLRSGFHVGIGAAATDVPTQDLWLDEGGLRLGTSAAPR